MRLVPPPDKIFGAMAALTAAFGALFAGHPGERVLTRVVEAKHLAHQLARVLQLDELSVLRSADSEALQAACSAFGKRFDRMHSTLKKARKHPKALIQSMGPAVACFEVCFHEAPRQARARRHLRYSSSPS